MFPMSWRGWSEKSGFLFSVTAVILGTIPFWGRAYLPMVDAPDHAAVVNLLFQKLMGSCENLELVLHPAYKLFYYLVLPFYGLASLLGGKATLLPALQLGVLIFLLGFAFNYFLKLNSSKSPTLLQKAVQAVFVLAAILSCYGPSLYWGFLPYLTAMVPVFVSMGLIEAGHHRRDRHYLIALGSSLVVIYLAHPLALVFLGGWIVLRWFWNWFLETDFQKTNRVYVFSTGMILLLVGIHALCAPHGLQGGPYLNVLSAEPIRPFSSVWGEVAGHLLGGKVFLPDSLQEGSFLFALVLAGVLGGVTFLTLTKGHRNRVMIASLLTGLSFFIMILFCRDDPIADRHPVYIFFRDRVYAMVLPLLVLLTGMVCVERSTQTGWKRKVALVLSLGVLCASLFQIGILRESFERYEVFARSTIHGQRDIAQNTRTPELHPYVSRFSYLEHIHKYELLRGPECETTGDMFFELAPQLSLYPVRSSLLPRHHSQLTRN